MLSKSDMMNVLVQACPTFAPAWEGFLSEWEERGKEDLPLYVVLSELARHLVGMLKRQETEAIPTVFAAVERLHLEGDSHVREAAVVGLLEDMQNGNLHTTTEPEQFRPYLGATSLRWWEKLYWAWENREILTEN